MNRLAVISAVAFEAESCLEYLDEIDHPYEFFEIGIGPLNAEVFFSQNKAKFEGKDILYIGSCGSYQREVIDEPFFVNPTHVHWSPIADRFQLSESIEGLHPQFQLGAVKKISDLKDAEVFCSSSISTCENIKACFLEPVRNRGALVVENLEMYALRHLQGSYKSICFLMGVTNSICSTGREQWKKNFKKTALASKVLLSQLNLD